MLRSDAQVKRMTDLQMREKAKAEELKKAQELEALIAKAEAGGKLSNKEQRASDKSAVFAPVYSLHRVANALRYTI